ncbi:MAG TPA: hypothetical protein VFQ53_05085 [Kofleriaceae bacterium]|nr:hypothetical protein [Kofleriaceae bacterium]
MRKAWVVLVVAGCTDSAMEPPLPPIESSFDVVVDATSVAIYPRDHLTNGTCRPADAFPASTGTCLELLDTPTCDPEVTTCLERFVLDGKELAFRPSSTPRFYTALTATSTLTIIGCGRTAEVALPAEPMPTAVLQASRDASGQPVATWTTDLPSDTALVSLLYQVPEETRCHVEGVQTRTFEPTWPEQRSVEVRAFSPMTVVDTELGPLRIWRGNVVFAELTAP